MPCDSKSPLSRETDAPETIVKLECDIDDASPEVLAYAVRRQVMERVCLPRRFEQVATPWGEVAVKVATLPDGSERAAPEYEDCARLAREHDVPLQHVMQAAQSAALRFE